jgi:hypothetical protein
MDASFVPEPHALCLAAIGARSGNGSAATVATWRSPLVSVTPNGGLFDTGEGPLKAFRAASGIEHSVLAPDAREIAFA